MTAFLHRCELVFKVHARRTRIDHGFHQFKGIEHAAETRFGVGDDGREVIDVIGRAGLLAFHPLDLIAASQGIVDRAHHGRHGVHRVQGLVGVHRRGRIGVACDLPAREVNRLESGTHLLHGLVAGESAQRAHEGSLVQRRPQTLGATPGKGVFNRHRAAQSHYVLSRVAAANSFPTGIFSPVLLQSLCLELASGHDISSGLRQGLSKHCSRTSGRTRFRPRPPQRPEATLSMLRSCPRCSKINILYKTQFFYINNQMVKFFVSHFETKFSKTESIFLLRDMVISQAEMAATMWKPGCAGSRAGPRRPR